MRKFQFHGNKLFLVYYQMENMTRKRPYSLEVLIISIYGFKSIYINCVNRKHKDTSQVHTRSDSSDIRVLNHSAWV